MRTVLLVDDHDEARARMRRLIEEVFDGTEVFECQTFGDAKQCMAANNFDLAILDLALPDGNGEDLLELLQDKNPNCYVVISTIHDEGPRVVRALSRGAKGYLLKEQTEQVLKQAIDGIRLGIPPLSASITRRVLEYLRQNPDRNRRNDGDPGAEGAQSLFKSPGASDQPNVATQELTPREAEILILLARGFNRPDVAGILDISKHTVATHVSNIYAKLNISTRIEAAAAAQKLGLM